MALCTRCKQEIQDEQEESIAGLHAFNVDDKLIQWAKNNGCPDPQRYLQEFKDYWISIYQETPRKCRKNWRLTFQNRLRWMRDHPQHMTQEDLLAMHRFSSRDIFSSSETWKELVYDA